MMLDVYSELENLYKWVSSPRGYLTAWYSTGWLGGLASVDELFTEPSKLSIIDSKALKMTGGLSN